MKNILVLLIVVITAVLVWVGVEAVFNHMAYRLTVKSEQADARLHAR